MGIPSRMLAISFFVGLLWIKSSAGQAAYDKYCMPYKLAAGAACGLNAAANFAGACDTSADLECSGGVCVTAPSTTPTQEAITTPACTATGTQDANKCFEG